MNGKHNNSWKFVITIVVSIILANVGITFGVIKGNSEDILKRNQAKIESAESRLNELEKAVGIIENELGHMKESLKKIISILESDYYSPGVAD